MKNIKRKLIYDPLYCSVIFMKLHGNGITKRNHLIDTHATSETHSCSVFEQIGQCYLGYILSRNWTNSNR